MRKVLFFIFILFSFELYAQDLGVLSKGSSPDNHSKDDVYITWIETVNLSNIDIRNKMIYFCTDNIHLWDDFLYHFNSRFSKEIIVREGFQRDKFESEELYRICAELREWGRRNPSRPGTRFAVAVVSNENYGFVIKFSRADPITRYFFEIKTE